MAFLLSMILNEKALDPKHGITWQDGLLRIVRLNRQEVADDTPRRCELRCRWNEHSRTWTLRPSKIDPDEDLVYMDIRMSPAETDRFAMLIRRVIRMAEVIQVEAPVIANMVAEIMTPIIRQMVSSESRG